MGTFQTSRWSLVLAARDGGRDAERAFAALCRTYRPPVLAYVRRRGFAPAEAEDLTQAFFLKLVEHRYDARADRSRGRFRTFLVMALQRFLVNAHDAASAAKRGADRVLHDEQAAEHVADPSLAASPELVFDRAFTLATIEHALRELRREARAAGKEALFEATKDFLLEAPDPAAYHAVAERLGMKRNTLAVAVHRLRRRARELVRESLAETVADGHALAEEMRAMARSLAAD
jgi:RNA polymerase sigma-70 factor (ECF subfamily)